MAGWGCTHYLDPKMMRLPRPASPRALWRDIKALFAQRSPHQLIAALLALAIPVVIIVTFIYDADDAMTVPEQIIYVESWPASRTIEETKAAQAAYEKRRREFEEERRRSFQRVDESLNKLGI